MGSKASTSRRVSIAGDALDGDKGNSDVWQGQGKIILRFKVQNGREATLRPEFVAKCKDGKSAKKHRRSRR